MSRVWKRFLLTIAKYVGIVLAVFAWFLASVFIVDILSIPEKLQGPAFVLICLLAPAGVYFLRQVYIDIKEDVEREDKELLKKIKG